MSRYDGGWAPYVPVAERRRKAARAMEKLHKKGHPVAPVTITGHLIATTFWGRAWCDNMESYRDYASRLPRGRTYVRNGSVVDLQIAPGRITAMVSGSELYNVTITIKETPKAHWRAICTDCTGRIDSLVELLQGRLSKGVMERLCRQQGGLFPRPADIRFSCTCPDHALMCKHVAAVLYGVGARLDAKPELLFRLRAANEADLIADIGTALPIAKQGPAADRMLQTDDVSALFGLDMAAAGTPETEIPPAQSKTTRRRASAPSARVAVARSSPSRVPAPNLAGAKATAATGKTPGRPSAQMTAAKSRTPKPVVTSKAASKPIAPMKISAGSGKRETGLTPSKKRVASPMAPAKSRRGRSTGGDS